VAKLLAMTIYLFQKEDFSLGGTKGYSHSTPIGVEMLGLFSGMLHLELPKLIGVRRTTKIHYIILFFYEYSIS
jgi:hypothetical protein